MEFESPFRQPYTLRELPFYQVMSLISNPSGKANLVVLLPDLSNYTDWEHMIVSYMRARGCYLTVDPEGDLEK